MRETKFRAWDKDYKEMLDNIIIYQGEVYKNTMPVAVSPLNAELMQYTGLKDKNGKEIYEGDILRDGRKREFVVTWNNGIGSWVNRPLDNSNSYPCFNVGTVKHLEKIGNIYDNPELLVKT